ncbi:hypothetical protein [Burkholderia sp. Ac-20353]|uniref:hypothetical protein n=1 Tax=Burkholderia sp. Ac-20353 TaxID=2703894 RepID=UPI00197C04BF|nr:hypothetical protein [Burkholderia sp. Ac-20353]MBN3788528.1 hypothetical protein [Burkholderia sp. Ac-20353]
MEPDEGSLRWQIDKWLTLVFAASAHVTRYGRATSNTLQRYVVVQSSGGARPMEIIFFRHADGSWRVFPPTSRGPMMCPFLESKSTDFALRV